MANRNIVFSFQLKDEFTSVAKSISRSVDSIRQKFQKFKADLNELGVSWKSVGDTLSGWAGKMKWVSAGIIAAGGAALMAAGNYKQLAIEFRILTGSAEKGAALLKELENLSLSLGPFGYDDVMPAAKAMLNYGFATEDVVKNLRMLATLAKGGEIPLDSVVRAAGMALNTGRVERRSLLPMKKLGIEPLLEARLGLTHKVFKEKLAKGLIPASALFEVLNDKAATFGDLLGEIDRTTSDMMGDTPELFRQISVRVGEVLDKTSGANSTLGQFNEMLVYIRDNVGRWAEENPGVVKFIEIMALALIVATPLLVILAGIASAMAALAVAAAVVGIGMLPLAAIFVGIIALIVIAIKYWRQLANLFTSTKNWALNSGFGKALQLMGVIDTTNTNNANVDINIRKDKDVNASATGKSTPGLDLGINMSPLFQVP